MFAIVRSWSEILCELTIEVVEISFEGDWVMMRSSKDDRMCCESYWVGEFTSCANEVEWTSSARSSSILSGEVPGKLRSPQIMSRSTVSIPRVARSEPNSSKNIDLLEDGRGVVDVGQDNVLGWRPIFTSCSSNDEQVNLCFLG